MPVLVVAEHFELPLSIKEQIENSMSKLEELLPSESAIRLFFKKSPRHGFEAIITVHGNHEDLTYSESGDSLKELVSSLKTHIKRQLVARKEKRVHNRRKKPSSFPPDSAAS